MLYRLFGLATGLVLLSSGALAQTAEPTLSEHINATVAPITDFVSQVIFWNIPIGPGIPFIVIWLLVGAIFFTLRMGFINFRGFRQALRIVSGRYDDPKDPGEVTHFQALTAALSGTVGLGNIAGVAIAISIGGPGATLWMILAGLFGMASKFTECTLGLKYRRIDENGVVSGGPM